MAVKIVDYISPTQIGQFSFCPLSYRYCYVQGIKPPFNENIYLIYGSALHEALAFNYTQKIESRKDLDYAEIWRFFRTEFFKNAARIKIPEHDFQFKEMLMNSELVIKNYMLKVAPSIQPLLVEYKFELQLKKYPIKILGIFDLVTEDGWIIDHKTAGATYKKTWTQKRVDNEIQFTFYAAAYRKIFAKKEAGIRADVIPRLAGVDPLIISSFRTDEKISEVLEMATAIEKITKLGMFIPNTENCGQCPFNKVCPKKTIEPTLEEMAAYHKAYPLKP